jgi:hypothetical protein
MATLTPSSNTTSTKFVEPRAIRDSFVGSCTPTRN